MTALIIPCYIKSQWDINCLDRLFESVQKQTLPFERAYLIDDASPIKYEVHHNFVEQILLLENGGPAKARNIGINRALDQGSHQIFFTDHDCILDKNWNKEMTFFLETTDSGAV